VKEKGWEIIYRNNLFTLTPHQFLQNNIQNSNIIVFFFFTKCISLLITGISYYFNSRAFIVPSIGITAHVCYIFCLFQPLIHVKCTYPSQFTMLFVWDMCIPYFSHLFSLCTNYLQKQWQLKIIILLSLIVLFSENTTKISILIQRCLFLMQYNNFMKYLFFLMARRELLSVKLCNSEELNKYNLLINRRLKDMRVI